MNFPEVIEYTHNGEKYRAEYDGEHDNPDNCFYMVYQWEPMGFWFRYCHHTYKGIQEIINQQTKEKQMNVTTLKQQLEAAQQEITKLQQALEEAEKQEKEASAIKLKVPKDGELYTNTVLGYPSIRHECDVNKYFLYTFSSTNKAQAIAFADALAVMAEMRMQEGIVNPDSTTNYWAISGDESYPLTFDMWTRVRGISLFPCYKDLQAAKLAVETVGEQRVIECIKTMNFMTPESRGEI